MQHTLSSLASHSGISVLHAVAALASSFANSIQCAAPICVAVAREHTVCSSVLDSIIAPTWHSQHANCTLLAEAAKSQPTAAVTVTVAVTVAVTVTVIVNVIDTVTVACLQNTSVLG